MFRDLLASTATGNLCLKTGEQEKGAVPRLPQLALTVLCFIIHSKLFFEKGHIFKLESRICLPTLINTQPSSPFLAWPSF